MAGTDVEVIAAAHSPLYITNHHLLTFTECRNGFPSYIENPNKST
jgi:hypothetical protein